MSSTVSVSVEVPLRHDKVNAAPHIRNMGRVVSFSGDYFESAHTSGLMGVDCDIIPNRRIRRSKSNAVVTDYTRCGYLGLDEHPAVLEGAKDVLSQVASVHISVARTRLSIQPLMHLEERLAQLFGVHRIVAFPTVAAANMGALPLLASGLFTEGKKPIIVVDRLAHVTIQYHIPVMREETDVFVIEHNDMDQLEKLCGSSRSVVYVGDGAYSMGGAAPVSHLRHLQERFGLFVYLDDAHGISVIGAKGQGFVLSNLEVLGERTIISASLGKGFGVSGGFLMLGTSSQAEIVRRYAPTFGFSCAPYASGESRLVRRGLVPDV